MATSPALQTTALNAVATAYSWFSLHTADPGVSGASEAAGVGREQTAWGAVTPPSRPGGEVLFSIPSGGLPLTVTHWGMWTAESGGTFGEGGALPEPFTFETAGNYRLTPTLTFTPV